MFNARHPDPIPPGGSARTQPPAPGPCARIAAWYRQLPKGRKVILWVFVIWAAQAIPKWTAAIVADGETSAAIMKVLVTPR